jgi:hypothetical protein
MSPAPAPVSWLWLWRLRLGKAALRSLGAFRGRWTMAVPTFEYLRATAQPCVESRMEAQDWARSDSYLGMSV